MDSLTIDPIRATTGIRLRPIALPVEHGGWSLLLEPIVLALILAPTVPGFLLALTAVAAFLTRHPLKLALSDWRRSRRTYRTYLAGRFAAMYGFTAIVLLALAINSGGSGFLLPLFLASPFFLAQLVFDSFGRSRSLIAELAGSIATGSLASAIVINSGWSRVAALGLWALMSARTVPTIVYLRARLRRLHKKPASSSLVIAAHVASLLVVFYLFLVGIAPALSVFALVVLLLRAVLGFVRPEQNVTAKKLGLRELGFGALTVISIALGYILHW